jgi:type VI secretion system Hcp family effector
MSFDAFLKLEGPNVEGESTDATHAGEFELYSFGFGASNPVTIASGSTGMSGGKVTLQSFSVMKKTDKASPILFKMCCNGEHFDKATVKLRKAGGAGGQQEYLTYVFEKVFVENIQWSGSSGGDDTPSENLVLAYGTFKISYCPQKSEDGSLDAAVESGWDQTQNIETA